MGYENDVGRMYETQSVHPLTNAAILEPGTDVIRSDLQLTVWQANREPVGGHECIPRAPPHIPLAMRPLRLKRSLRAVDCEFVPCLSMTHTVDRDVVVLAPE